MQKEPGETIKETCRRMRPGYLKIFFNIKEYRMYSHDCNLKDWAWHYW